eukprot:695656-Prymnesium_polylepis.1
MAVGVTGNSLVFHSFELTASLFIHASPMLVGWTFRWYGQGAPRAAQHFKSGRASFGTPPTKRPPRRRACPARAAAAISLSVRRRLVGSRGGALPWLVGRRDVSPRARRFVERPRPTGHLLLLCLVRAARRRGSDGGGGWGLWGDTGRAVEMGGGGMLVSRVDPCARGVGARGVGWRGWVPRTTRSFRLDGHVSRWAREQMGTWACRGAERSRTARPPCRWVPYTTWLLTDGVTRPERGYDTVFANFRPLVEGQLGIKDVRLAAL